MRASAFCAGCAAVVIPGTAPERLLLVLAAAAFALLSDAGALTEQDIDELRAFLDRQTH